MDKIYIKGCEPNDVVAGIRDDVEIYPFRIGAAPRRTQQIHEVFGELIGTSIHVFFACTITYANYCMLLKNILMVFLLGSFHAKLTMIHAFLNFSVQVYVLYIF